MHGYTQMFGTPWRPMEQGLVEGAHEEVQMLFGILVKEVTKCFPDAVGEPLHCDEHMIHNTPESHGFTPRDLDRRWSMHTPFGEGATYGPSERVQANEYVRGNPIQMLSVGVGKGPPG